MHPSPLPAHLTKHLPLLHYPFRNNNFLLAQQNDGFSTGTALWLGAQCLSAFLAENFTSRNRLKVIELGSGIGLTALAMSSLGWDVLATDLPHIISSVLAQNISRNLTRLSGSIQIQELDWTAELPWDDRSPGVTISTSSSASLPEAGALSPPFDLIVTADTIYTPELIQPLLRTLHALSKISVVPGSRPPLVFVCLERRDPELVDRFLACARDPWHFHTEQVQRKKITKAMEKSGLKWQREDWDDVEIWKLRWEAETQAHGQTAT
ncbi:hypothetical protein PLEOSDRAFT_1091377 [Pleurotus ostreatus PC15]|uniref:Uncharacterized protein n=1 Tax=Pleurotus ostreatus (strain PC15) TaxID=1137138 RepID=A0A067P1U5_PLEO1|nr:hypothetical protein PLEOSDRAFT_1091377 [Pleurotus ostreatus PC15]